VKPKTPLPGEQPLPSSARKRKYGGGKAREAKLLVAGKGQPTIPGEKRGERLFYGRNRREGPYLSAQRSRLDDGKKKKKKRGSGTSYCRKNQERFWGKGILNPS